MTPWQAIHQIVMIARLPADPRAARLRNSEPAHRPGFAAGGRALARRAASTSPQNRHGLSQRELTAQSKSRRPLMTMNLPDPPAHVVVLASGGLDSTTLAYHLRDMGANARLLSFDYGQRHARELECARQVAGGLGVPHDVADLRSVGGLLRGSALTDPRVPVPDGHYAAESMRATVVP